MHANPSFRLVVALLALGIVSIARPAVAAVDVFGDPLPERAKARIGTTRFRHGDAVTAAALQNKPSLEVRRRIEQLLAEMPDNPARVTAAPREIRCVELLEGIGTAEARRVLLTLAGGIEEAELTQQAKASLARLTRGIPPQP